MEANIDLQDILVLNLTRAVQLCVDIACHLLADSGHPSPTNMGESFRSLADVGIINQPVADRMVKVVGFRNIAVHNYETINWEIVRAICTTHLDDFKEFTAAVVKYCDL